MIRFVSTRGQSPAVSFEQALFQGLAPDGGLYLPERTPTWPSELWSGREATTFPSLAFFALRNWLEGQVDDEALAAALAHALSFPVPVVPVSSSRRHGGELFVLELFHGPTLSFKDFGARVMARLAADFLLRSGRKSTVLVATSGDTGSAVADGFSGLPGIEVVLLYPKGQVSPLQEAQLTARRPGVRVFSVEGTFDDCQRLVKSAFADPELAPLSITSANSINIGRLLPQTLYYLWAWRMLQARPIFCTPSGNLGNLTGGVLAAEAGLPVAKFIAAHNANRFFPEVLADPGARFRPSIRTLSNAMDVGAPSNFERLNALLGRERLPGAIWGTSVSDAETVGAMRRVFQRSGYVADPHTAVGIEAAERFRDAESGDEPIIVLGTAHPAKFPEVVAEALGIEPPVAEALERLKYHPKNAERLEADQKAFRAKLLAG